MLPEKSPQGKSPETRNPQSPPDSARLGRPVSLFPDPSHFFRQRESEIMVREGGLPSSRRGVMKDRLTSGLWPGFSSPFGRIPGVVREGGLEPPHLSVQDPKSCASASSAILAQTGLYTKRCSDTILTTWNILTFQPSRMGSEHIALKIKLKDLLVGGLLISGEPRWNRTINLRIKSPLLCQLS